MKHPIDLLPIPFPLTDTNAYDDDFFYNNVIMPILPYVLEMESNGIPIDLGEVKKLEELTTNVLTNVDVKLKENPIIQEFLSNVSKEYKDNTQVKIKNEDSYKTTFCRNNIVHRNFVINEYLKSIHKEKDCLDNWKIKDIKKYADLTGNKFLRDIAEDNILNPNTASKIAFFMDVFALKKAQIYNDKVKAKVEAKAKKIAFNPGSTKQKEMLFQFLGIESEEHTPKGKEKWNRDQLERLKKKLEMELEDGSV